MNGTVATKPINPATPLPLLPPLVRPYSYSPFFILSPLSLCYRVLGNTGSRAEITCVKMEISSSSSSTQGLDLLPRRSDRSMYL